MHILSEDLTGHWLIDFFFYSPQQNLYAHNQSGPQPLFHHQQQQAAQHHQHPSHNRITAQSGGYAHAPMSAAGPTAVNPTSPPAAAQQGNNAGYMTQQQQCK